MKPEFDLKFVMNDCAGSIELVERRILRAIQEAYWAGQKSIFEAISLGQDPRALLPNATQSKEIK